MREIKKALGHKLKDVVPDFDDEVLYIGCKTAFFFIGTKEEFYDYVTKASADKKVKLLKTVCDSKQTIINSLDEVSGYKFDESHLPKIAEYGRKLMRSANNYISAKQELEVFFEYGDRTIKDIYYRDPDGINFKEIVIRVSGMDVGQYWTRGEWQKANRVN